MITFSMAQRGWSDGSGSQLGGNTSRPAPAIPPLFNGCDPSHTAPKDGRENVVKEDISRKEKLIVGQIDHSISIGMRNARVD